MFSYLIFNLWIITFLLWYKIYHNEEINELRREGELIDEVNDPVNIFELIKIFKYYKIIYVLLLIIVSINVVYFNQNVLENLDVNQFFLINKSNPGNFYNLYRYYFNSYRWRYWC